MEKTNRVLAVCLKQAQGGAENMSVFDLMYETSLAYPDLKTELDRLVKKKELEAIDIKTYKFIGNINRDADKLLKKLPHTSKNDAERPVTYDVDEVVEAMREQIERLKKIEGDDSVKKLFEEDASEISMFYMRRNALKMCIESGNVSAYMLQHHFGIGYLRACRLVDWMESNGFISPSDGVKPRKVLITMEEFKRRFGDDEEDNGDGESGDEADNGDDCDFDSLFDFLDEDDGGDENNE